MEFTKSRLKLILLIIGHIIWIVTFFTGQAGVTDKVFAMGMVALIVALWWIFEVLPLGITALVPLVAYPFLGIMKGKDIAPIYMSSVLLLFIGGFFVAIAMQRWNLHKRIALTIISFFGSEPSRLMMGFMAATGFLSMWISNTASCVMMVSIGLAIVKSYEEMVGEGRGSQRFATALMMAIAYSATIGGMATLVGTPPNLAFTRIYAMSFPAASEVSFASWVLFGVPISLIIVSLAWVVLKFLLLRNENLVALSTDVIEEEKEKLGPVKWEEKWLLVIFVTMALGWIFRRDLNLGFLTIPGWSNLIGNPSWVDDGTVAVMMALTLFMIPARSETGRKALLDGAAIKEIPWQTILLFGGGFALAKGIQASGLSAAIGEKFSALEGVPVPVVVATLTTGMSFLTELTSNMASTEMLLPILAAIAKSADINPISLMVPATLAASSAFMLPAATAPNAIIFGSNRVKIIDMVRVGFVLNLVAIVVITLFSLFIIPLVLK